MKKIVDVQDQFGSCFTIDLPVDFPVPRAGEHVYAGAVTYVVLRVAYDLDLELVIVVCEKVK